MNSSDAAKNARKAVLMRGQELLASGHSAVTAEIESMIGAMASFLSYQTALQGEADTLLTLGAAKLAQHIESVIGSDIVDVVLERIRSERSVLSAVNEAQTIEWSARLLEANLAHEEKLKAAHAGYAQLQELAQRIPSLVALLNARQADLDTLSAQRTAFEDYQRSKTSLQSVLQTAQHKRQAESAQLAGLQGQFTDPAALFEQFQQLTEAARRHHEVVEQLTEARNAVQSAQAQLAKTAPVYAAELEEAVSDAADTREKLAALSLEIAVSADKLRSHQALLAGAACPTCNRAFDGHDHAGIEGRTYMAQAEYQQLLDRRTVLERLREARETRQADLEQRVAVSAQWSAELAKTQETCRLREADLELLPAVDSAQLQQLSDQYQAASALKAQLDQSQTTLRTLELEQAQAQVALDTLVPVEPIEPIRLDAAKQALDQTQADLKAAQLEDAALRERYAALCAAIEALATEIATLEAHLKEAVKTRQRIALLDRLSKYLRANRDRFTEHAWNAVLGYASSFASSASGGDLEGLVRT
ncbi:MAG: hypothetical protein EOM91_22455, partial [Sphingobacteriia bacterium]|nr:hypothetical protein [Sphingobacteriia bacterium]